MYWPKTCIFSQVHTSIVLADCEPFQHLAIAAQATDIGSKIKYLRNTYAGDTYGIPNDTVIVTCSDGYFPFEAPDDPNDIDFKDLDFGEIAFVCREMESSCERSNEPVLPRNYNDSEFECREYKDECMPTHYQWISSVGDGDISTICQEGTLKRKWCL